MDLIDSKEALGMTLWFDALSERKTERDWKFKRQDGVFLLQGGHVIYAVDEGVWASFLKPYGMKRKAIDILLDSNPEMLEIIGNFFLQKDLPAIKQAIRLWYIGLSMPFYHNCGNNAFR